MRGLLLALGAALISGLAVFVNSYGVKEFADATVYTTAKNCVAAVVLIAMCLLLVRRRAPAALAVPQKGSHVLALAAIAIVGGSVPFVLFFEGLAHATSGPVQAQFINKTLVIWVALLAVSVLGERLGALQAGALALLVLGQAALSGGVGAAFTPHFGRGELMIFAATLMWAVEVVLAKVLLRSVSSWTVALGRMVAGSALLIMWVVVTGKASQLTGMDAHQWVWVAATGLVLAGYVATWLAALAAAPAVNVTAVLVAAVPVTALLQTIVRHAPLRPQLGGLALVVAGCLVVVATMLPLGARRRVAIPG
jgi:drug/metabolite transporter (DMT)-like permease